MGTAPASGPSNHDARPNIAASLPPNESSPSADSDSTSSYLELFGPSSADQTMAAGAHTRATKGGSGSAETEEAKAAAKAKSAGSAAATVAAAWAARAQGNTIHQAKPPRSAAPGEIPIVSVPARRRTRPVVLAAAAVVIVAAIGVPLGARWLRAARDGEPAQPSLVAAGVPAADGLATPPGTSSPATAAGESTTAPAKAAASSRSKPTARRPNPSTPKVAPAVAPSPEPEAPVLLAAAPLPALVSAPPPPNAPAPPIGRFFEPKDVDESPQIATRVEPQLPADLSMRPLNDVVVVRVLVSQTGHPFRITLLRKSRLGRSLDDAVVAAVTQWTFSPARKRGEAVSCWYNVGVPVSRAD